MAPIACEGGTRHRAIAAAAAAAALAAAGLAAATASPAPPVALTPHLLVDDSWIASRTGTVRVLGRPAKLGPVIDGPHEGNFTPYVSVVHDAASGKYRLWYDAAQDNGAKRLGYVESSDGLEWSPPKLLRLESPTDEMHFASGVTRAPGGRGYLIAWAGSTGNWVSKSRDGLSWTPLARVATADEHSDAVTLVRAGSRLVLIAKTDSRPGEDFGGPPVRNVPRAGFRRLVGESWSDDGGRTWSPTVRVFEPDARDPGVTQFYGMGGVVRRGDLYVGFLRILRDDVGAGIGYTVLAWSHDGIHWRRERAPFLSPSPEAGWDHAMAWADAQVVDPGRTLVYYGGYAIDHKSDPFRSRSIGVASLPTDRYAGRAARGRGVLVTRPVALGGALTLNGSGRFAVDVLQQGRLVDRCVAAGNRIALVPRCRRPLPHGKATLRIVLKRATLYAFSTRG